MVTNAGTSVADISSENKVLLIFLRHLACIFCREALKDISKIGKELEKLNTTVVFVHMAENEIADDVFKKYPIKNFFHISDIDKKMYSAFGLAKGDFKQLFGFKSFLGMGRAGLKGHLPQSGLIGDPNQMPGVFVIENENVTNYFLYNSVGDYPDYLSMIKKSKSK